MIHLRPSSSPVWTKCALAPRLMAMAPAEEPGDPAREGTCAAWVAEMVLRGERADCASMIGEAHGNGWVVDTPMAHYVQGYVDVLRGYGGKIDVERKVRLNDYIAGTPDSFATVDDDTLHVDDLKYGFEIVEPTTPQIYIYAGALVRHIYRYGGTLRRVVLGIYQPRAFHPSGIHRTISMAPEDLMRNVQEIERAGAAAQRDDAMATPGRHCRRCSGAAHCAAVAHEAYKCHTVMLNGQQRAMTAQEMAREMDFLATAEALLKGRKDAVEAEATARRDRGESIPGWHMERGHGQRRWKFDAKTVRMVTGVDPTSGKMVTPAELERQGASPETVKHLTETPLTRPKWKPVPQGYYAALFTTTTQTGDTNE